jgi:hypothetical protein
MGWEKVVLTSIALLGAQSRRPVAAPMFKSPRRYLGAVDKLGSKKCAPVVPRYAVDQGKEGEVALVVYTEGKVEPTTPLLPSAKLGKTLKAEAWPKEVVSVCNKVEPIPNA